MNNVKPFDNEMFNILYQIDVANVTEKKNGLTYLSWAWAWAEVKKRFKDVNYKIYKDEETKEPYIFNPKTGYMVYTEVTINGLTHEMWLPVMDSANKAMKDVEYSYKVKEYKDRKWTGNYLDRFVEPATMFDINKTIMRCLVKNLAMFGLGLYIYAGEDLPEDISMYELASERNVKMFLKIIRNLSDEYDFPDDKAVEMIADQAKITADYTKWTNADLGILKRGFGWLKDKLEEIKKEQKQEEVS